MTRNLETAKAKLTIMSGSLSPEEISRRVGLPFDDARRIGDKKGKSERVWDVNLWYIHETSTGEVGEGTVDVALAGCLRRLRERLGPFVAAVRAFSQTETVELGLYMLAKSVPAIHLSADAVAFLHDLGAELDIDVVLYEDDEQRSE